MSPEGVKLLAAIDDRRRPSLGKGHEARLNLRGKDRTEGAKRLAIIPDLGSLNDIRVDLVEHDPFAHMGLQTHTLRLDLRHFESVTRR